MSEGTDFSANPNAKRRGAGVCCSLVATWHVPRTLVYGKCRVRSRHLHWLRIADVHYSCAGPCGRPTLATGWW